MKRLFHTLVFNPELIFETWLSRFQAYFLLYIFPTALVLSILASFFIVGTGYTALIIALVFFFGYSIAMLRFIYVYYSKVSLEQAARKQLPRAVKRYFNRSYPGVYLPIMVSNDRKLWVVYGHVAKIDMARTITYLDYYLMPPIKQFREYYMDNMSEIKHQYMIIIDAQNETFQLTNKMTLNSYPVTVFDEDEIT